MEKILEGTLNSKHPDEVKALLIDKIALVASSTKDEDSTRKMLKYCATVITQSPNALIVSKLRKLITVWTREHSTVAVKFLAEENENILLSGCDTEKIKWLELVTQMLSIIQTSNDSASCILILQKLVQCFLVEETLEVNSCLAKAIVRSWSEHSVKGSEESLISKIILLLKSIKFSFEEHLETQNEYLAGIFNAKVAEVNTISALFSKVVNLDKLYLQIALNELFKELSSVDSASNISLASLMQNFPTELSSFAAEILSKDKSLKNKNIQNLFEKMIRWLLWPGVKNLDVWIISIFKHLLMESDRQELMTELIRNNITKIFQCLFIPGSREITLPIFSYTMLVYQHSPELFLQVAPKIPALISKIKEEQKDIHGPSAVKIITELVYTLMYKFPGHPIVYTDLLEAIKDFQKPSEDSMKRWLSESCSLGRNSLATTQTSQPTLNRKSITGKTGLVNLGNTCYMNSVIQALFMLDGFRESLLSMRPLQNRNTITYNLQKLMAFLLLSERPAISPSDFNRVSRPAWFRQGAQQDCSEFLKHLLDVIEQEDKSQQQQQQQTSLPKDLKLGQQLHEMFTGECHVDVKCLNCNYVSSRFEAFNDIPLSFPDNPDADAYCLKGGDISRGIANTIANAAGNISPSDGNEIGKTPSDLSLLEAAESSMMGESAATAEEKAVQQTQSGDQSSGNSIDARPLDLQTLLRNYLSVERLAGQNQYRCDNCASLQDAEQRHYFSSCPKYLVLTLKRFTYDTKTHTRSKVLKNVHFPLDNLVIPIHVSDDSGGYDCEMHDLRRDDDCCNVLASNTLHESVNATEQRSCKSPKLAVVTESTKCYSLVAVIVHSGVSSESGHYYCYSRKGPGDQKHQSSKTSDLPVKPDSTSAASGSTTTSERSNASSNDSGAARLNSNEWYIFNDSSVSYAAGNSAVQNLHINFPRDTPYVFIYEENGVQHLQDSSKSLGINPELALLVEEDNGKFIKEQDRKNYGHIGKKFDYFKSRYKKDEDDDNNDGKGGGGSSGFCGKSFAGLASDASRFIF
eukprot:gene7553-8390_t